MTDDEVFEELVGGHEPTSDTHAVEALRSLIQRHGANWDETAPWGLIEELTSNLLHVDPEDVVVLLQAFHDTAKEVGDGMTHNWVAAQSVPIEERAAKAYVRNIKQVYVAMNSIEMLAELDYATDHWLDVEDMVLSDEQRWEAIAHLRATRGKIVTTLEGLEQ
jgi:hypothetical protein